MAHWTFETTQPRYAKRDTFEGEFFKGESQPDELYGRTDALVREVMQNSLDARDPESSGPVRVRFAFSQAKEELKQDDARVYLDGLVEHLDALNVEHVNLSNPHPSMQFLLVEDFGTRGLCGEPERDKDPVEGDGDQSFYYFWRNIGRSGKSGTERGRWGLGKSVFPSASMINAFFGLTVRADGRCLLMGQATTKVHRLGDQEFVPEGYFHDTDTRVKSEWQMPFETPCAMVDRFRRDFGISRTTETGLSVVVPYPLDLYLPEDVLRSVIVHFFVPILKRELIVEVSDSDGRANCVERSTIRAIAEQLDWEGQSKDRRHTCPPFDFAEWAIARQKSESLVQGRQDRTATDWQSDVFLPDQLMKLRRDFESGERIAVRIPLSIKYKGKNRKDEGTYFDAFLETDSGLPNGEDHFVREGMRPCKRSCVS